MYDLSILSCYQKQGEMGVTAASVFWGSETLGRSRVLSALKSSRYQPSGASQTTDPCRTGSRVAAERGFGWFFLEAVDLILVRMSAPLLSPDCAAACRWGCGNAHRHLPAVSWEQPQPWGPARHLCHPSHSSRAGDTAGCPLRLPGQSPRPHCSWLSPP